MMKSYLLLFKEEQGAEQSPSKKTYGLKKISIENKTSPEKENGVNSNYGMS